MVFKIPLSRIGNDRDAFEQEVIKHIARMVEFNKTRGKARPVAHPLVEMAIKRVQHPIAAKKPDEYTANYEIVDDTPIDVTPSLDLEEKKTRLTHQLRVAEQQAKEKIFPIRKQRLFMMGINPLLLKPKEDITDDERTRLAAFEDFKSRMAAVELKGAQAESDIEDLTDDTVDSWQLPQLG